MVDATGHAGACVACRSTCFMFCPDGSAPWTMPAACICIADRWRNLMRCISIKWVREHVKSSRVQVVHSDRALSVGPSNGGFLESREKGTSKSLSESQLIAVKCNIMGYKTFAQRSSGLGRQKPDPVQALQTGT